MAENISYHSNAIAEYFSSNRRTWDQFYPSERTVIDSVAELKGGRLGRVLDVGCACGGLGAALGARFSVSEYVGLDINEQAIEAGRRAKDIVVPHTLMTGDVVTESRLEGQAFDTVFNLSCADWNVDFHGILSASWEKVAPGGTLIVSLRLTDGVGERDIARSWQYIHYERGRPIPVDAEKAAYVVLNLSEALAEFGRLCPAKVFGYGYWGAPSPTARTPFERLLFAVFAIDKAPAGLESQYLDVNLKVPLDIWRAPHT